MPTTIAETSMPPDRSTDDALDEIIYAISHDLRASIRALRELPEWMKEDLDALGIALPDGPTELLGHMQDHALRLDAMLAGLLAYSRVGRLQGVEILEPEDIFKQVIGAIAPPETAQFFCRFNAVPIRMGMADAAKIFEILLSNALSHGAGSTGAEVEITSCRSGEFWELLVADAGPGIPPERVEQALRPMSRLSGGAEAPFAGMGLAILDRLARHYGGDLGIETRKRRGGCLVRLRLPVLA